MKIFAIDDYTKVINSEVYKKACMNYKFNMLENRFTELGSMIQHIFWTDEKIKQWKKERPNENSSKQYNDWLESKFEQFKMQLLLERGEENGRNKYLY